MVAVVPLVAASGPAVGTAAAREDVGIGIDDGRFEVTGTDPDLEYDGTLPRLASIARHETEPASGPCDFALRLSALASLGSYRRFDLRRALTDVPPMVASSGDAFDYRIGPRIEGARRETSDRIVVVDSSSDARTVARAVGLTAPPSRKSRSTLGRFRTEWSRNASQ